MSVKTVTVGPLGRRWVATCPICARPLGHHGARETAEGKLTTHIQQRHSGGEPDAA